MDNKNRNNSDPIFKGIFDTALDAIITINETGIIQSFNPSAEKLFRYLQEEVIDQNITLLMPPPYSKEHDGYLFHYRKTSKRKIIGIGREVEGKRKDGSIFPMHLSVNEAVINDKRIFIGFARDISVLKTAESDLKRSEEKANAILDTAADGIITINAKGVIHSINTAVTKLFNYVEKDLIGQPINILMPLPYTAEHDKYMTNYLNTGQKKIIGIGREVSALRKDGTTFPIFLSVSEFRLGGQRFFTGIIRDISDLKETEQELKVKNEQLQAQNWYRQAQVGLFDVLRGEKTKSGLCDELAKYISDIAESDVSLLYLSDGKKLHLTSGTAIPASKLKNKTIELNEGIIGKSAKHNEIIQFNDLKQNKLTIESSILSIPIKTITVIPYSFGDKVLAVLELGNRESLPEPINTFLRDTQESIGISLNMAFNREQLNELLLKTQAQARALIAQKDELKEVNQELESKSKILQQQQEKMEQTNEELQHQQEEMEQTNEELQEQRRALEDRKHELEIKNTELLQTQQDLNAKAKALELSNQYKSEFLANMSHELRTPLNSILILSQLFMDNKENSLNQEQIGSAQTIYNSGCDLLELINDILDLSKVEANHMEIYPASININELKNDLYDIFEPLANNKGLDIEISISDDFPVNFTSDPMRLEQIIKNFLSNAIKFTKTGSVKLLCSTSTSLENPEKQDSDNNLYFEVIDTGIGIQQEKLNLIFEAFNQADGSTSRQYGGSGLGLTISEKLTRLLYGKINVQTELGKGSTFSLQIPKEFPGKLTSDGSSINTKYINKVNEKKSIPNNGDNTSGDFENLHLLLVDDNISEQKAITSYLSNQAISLESVSSVKQAANYLNSTQVDGIILDLMLKDESGFDLLDEIKKSSTIGSPPIIIYTGKDITEKEQQYLSAYSSSIIIKGKLSPKRLLEEIKLHFKRSNTDKHSLKKALVRTINDTLDQTPMILIADDDERNIYSLKQLLSGLAVIVLTAKNGKEACEIYKEYPNISIIVMDMMMPIMDGYDATKSIRRRNKDVPIIALTAKAMKGDKQKCLDAGCTDYLAKPINPEQLSSLIKIWL